MKVLAFKGLSGSGKTTAIEMLIRHFVATGSKVGAIKHTHHEINTEQRGDTLRFRRAGAEPVILAGKDRAVIFSASGTEKIEFESPRELLDRLVVDMLFIEGFKGSSDWPVVELRAGEWKSIEALLRLL